MICIVMLNSIEVIKSIFASWRIFIWIVNLIFVGALSFGISRFFIKLVRRNNPRIEDLFDGFKILGTTILAHIALSIFKFLWYALAAIVIGLLGILASFMFSIIQTYTEQQLITFNFRIYYISINYLYRCFNIFK